MTVYNKMNLTEDNSAFVYKLETIVRSVVKELSEPIVKKCTRQCPIYEQNPGVLLELR
jgi:hypothetical protein